MQRINSLEGLRGLAAILVLFNHLGVMFYPAHYWGGVLSHCEILEYYLGHTPLFFLVSGNSGVNIFLILTGFGSYMACDKGKESIVKYASLRFFKLALIMLMSSIVIWTLFNFNLIYFSTAIEVTHTPWIQGYAPYDNNFWGLFTGNWFDISTKYNPTLWTMKNIFFSSVICVLVYILWGNLRKGYLASLIVGVCFIIMGYPNYIGCILGYNLANYYKKNSSRNINSAVGVGIFLIAVFLCGFPSEIKSQFFLYSFASPKYAEYFHIVGAFLLVFICLFCSPIRRIAESKVFLTLGKYSISIYIVHFIVIVSITSYLFTKLINEFSYNVSVLIVWSITTIAVILIAVPLKSVINKLYRGLDNIYIKAYKYIEGR